MNNFEEKLDSLYKQRALIESVISHTPIETSVGGWFIPHKSQVEIDGNYRINKEDLTLTYLTYAENNQDFEQCSEINLIDTEDGSYNISFEGTKSQGIQASLSIIFYNKQKEKIRTEFLLLNESKVLKIDNQEKFIRFAIRLKGKGFIDINKLTVNSIPLWNNIKETKLKYLDNTHWGIPVSPNIRFNQLSKEINFNLENNEHIYLSYKELNKNFEFLPIFPIKLEGNTLSASFKGEKDGTLDVRLAVIFYNDRQKIGVEQIPLNQDKKIPVPDGAISARLVIRVASVGNLKLEKVSLDGREFWNPYSFHQEVNKETIFDHNVPIDMNMFRSKVDNLVTYHDEKQVVHSYLIGEQYKHFYISKISESPETERFEIKQKYIYDFFLRASIKGDLELTLLIEAYDSSDRIGIYQINSNQATKIQFNHNTKTIRMFLRIKGKGYLNNLSLGINESEVLYSNQLKLELNPKAWFCNKNHLDLSEKKGSLVGEMIYNANKKHYMSYQENNNKFSIPPKKNLMEIKGGKKYTFNFRAQMSEDIELIPMVIGYANDLKVQTYQLKVNDVTVYRPQNNVNKIRITVRVGGVGEFSIDEIEIRETPIANNDTSPNWTNKREIEQLNLLPTSNKISELKMAAIFDEFTRACFAEECRLIQFTPDNWLETLTKEMPDILMVESAWQGNNGSWFKRVGNYGEEQNKALFDLISWCNAKNIPTVFWNKEDPVHYNRFIATAKHFDYIFTTDEDRIPFYKEEVGHENVYSLPFAAQPKIHNPVKIQDERINKACFAGSYYRLHEERSIDMDRILDIATEYGLDIYDRNYEKTSAGLMPNHSFPEKYMQNIKGSLKYYEIDRAYKGYKVMINVNTVKHSPTMFSRRVFEGLACGTPVISTYAKGVENLLGDLVYISEDHEEIRNAFETLLNSEENYRDKAVKGIREVLTHHTYTHRLSEIIEKTELNFINESPKVTVIGFAQSKEDFFNLLNKFEKQTYENKELFILTDLFQGYLDLYKKYNNKNVKTFIRSYFHNYQNIREWIDTPYCAYFSTNDHYGENFLTDLMLCTTFTDSEVIGKKTYFTLVDRNLIEKNSNSEYEYVQSLKLESSVFKPHIFSKENLSDLLINIEKGKDLSAYIKQGYRLFSNDKFNYVENGDSITEIQTLKQIEI
ncbi:CgeB family protein [Bacillus altitudinis]|uniref:CgeB family protein n=1 Tax=Bacillus altitudinis TaxID=293387 RepID=UPI001B835844|nr:glycosyltransferase [Bacillus altitudinis]MBR0577928.1 glycosyltransferase [Bacillus altitudinis A23-8]MBX7001388.1 glycosyltransferase [Bacillus aerophilus]MBX7012987.1 glycosyltransferase [Bacillus aerophilus]MED4560708.1 glycosyltransferase [Bacillus altitudinis]